MKIIMYEKGTGFDSCEMCPQGLPTPPSPAYHGLIIMSRTLVKLCDKHFKQAQAEMVDVVRWQLEKK